MKLYIFIACLLITGSASAQVDVGALRAILKKTQEELTAVQAEQAVVAAALVDERVARSAAQAQADRLMQDAQTNADGIMKANVRLAAASEKITDLEESASGWMWKFIGLLSAIGIYIFLRLSPWTRLIIP